MKTKEEVELALQSARERYRQLDLKRFNYDNPTHQRESATVLCQMWAGRIAAYEFVLGLEGDYDAQ